LVQLRSGFVDALTFIPDLILEIILIGLSLFVMPSVNRTSSPELVSLEFSIALPVHPDMTEMKFPHLMQAPAPLRLMTGVPCIANL
jgi:hypothetical protein